jgi:hypothetical protein
LLFQNPSNQNRFSFPRNNRRHSKQQFGNGETSAAAPARLQFNLPSAYLKVPTNRVNL